MANTDPDTHDSESNSSDDVSYWTSNIQSDSDREGDYDLLGDGESATVSSKVVPNNPGGHTTALLRSPIESLDIENILDYESFSRHKFITRGGPSKRMAIKAAVKSVPQRARKSALDLYEYVRAKSQPLRAVGYRLHEYISQQKRTVPCGLPETGHETRGIRRVDATVREASPQIHPDDAPTGLYATEHDSPEDESRIGDARISYTCNPIIHGLYREKPASLIIFDFDLNYDNTCAITRADIIITFGSSITDQLIRPHDVEIVPYATRLFGPKKACQEVSDATHIGSSATWRLKLNVSSMGIELPERADTISGTRTDSGWRLVGGPTFVDKPFRVRRVFRWRLTGHEFNRFPVPECFSVGMTVQHNMVDFWMKVRVEGALRGVVTNGMAKLSGWKTHHPNGWRVQPKRIERDINQSLLMREMQGKWLFDQWDPKEHEEENGG